MRRLLPLILLASCAADEPRNTASEGRPAGYRIINIVDMHLSPPSQSNGQRIQTREFQRGDTLGSLQETGAWSIRAAVTHPRLRCGTYETGIQLGAGDRDCSSVRWLTNVEFGTKRTQCNNATAVHAGGGEFPDTGSLFRSSTCARVVTRCTGAC